MFDFNNDEQVDGLDYLILEELLEQEEKENDVENIEKNKI